MCPYPRYGKDCLLQCPEQCKREMCDFMKGCLKKKNGNETIYSESGQRESKYIKIIPYQLILYSESNNQLVSQGLVSYMGDPSLLIRYLLMR